MATQQEIQDKIDLLSGQTEPNTISPTNVGEIMTDLNHNLSYSTTETLTGGTWIDGKPIYRRVIQGNFNPNPTEAAFSYNILTKGTVSSLNNIPYITGYNSYIDNAAAILGGAKVGELYFNTTITALTVVM